MIELSEDDIVIRPVQNGWIVYHVNAADEEEDTFVFTNDNCTSAKNIIKHVFEDHIQMKNRGGFVLNWHSEGWEHSSSDSDESSVAVDNTDSVKVSK